MTAKQAVRQVPQWEPCHGESYRAYRGKARGGGEVEVRKKGLGLQAKYSVRLGRHVVAKANGSQIFCAFARRAFYEASGAWRGSQLW